MDAELMALAGAAGTAIVTMLTTDVWQTAKTSLGALWRGARPDHADVIEADLVQARRALLAARIDGDDATERALVVEWQERIGRLLASEPGLAAQLRRLLSDELTSDQPDAGQARPGPVMTATASDHGRVYQVGQGNMTILDK